MELEEYYNYLIDMEIVSEDALKLVTYINGYNEDTLNSVLYCQTGYRDLEQYLEYNDRETFKEYYPQDDDDELI